ncbi:PR domain zinc finger protein 2 [Thalassophryne amazonica]|uniref:PR domain zinc finger protein 2 n=1 Tax=Thalassophryne amazonica TaxID=390379 RepID=UPI0014712C83|nr:PR domain zinc finger protein 2 [Thalassophryne amazonica]
MSTSPSVIGCLLLSQCRSLSALLVYYSVEDKPEITAALEEERSSRRKEKNKTKNNSRRGEACRFTSFDGGLAVTRKLLERSRQAGLGRFTKTSGTKYRQEMWDGEKGQNEEDEKSSTLWPPLAFQENHPRGSTGQRKMQDMSVVIPDTGNEEEEEEEEEEDIDDLHDPNEVQHLLTMQTGQCPLGVESVQSKQLLVCGSTGNDSQNESSSIPGQEPLVDLDPDDDIEGDPHGESYPCQHCERHFSTRQGLERHIHIHAITNQQTQMFKCRYCNKSFGSQVGRRRHERRHDGGPKKRPGFLGGSVSLQNPLVQNDGSSPDCTSPTSHYIAIGTQLPGGPLQNSDMQIKELGPHVDRPFIGDESGESKELHPCKYCNKAFGTHTNMRRHQRRIHERHLLPKGVRRKGMFLQETSVQQQQQPGESPSTSPPLVYVPSADTEDEADGDDYVVDISKNISENLSFYIDGKILSTSSVSSCDVIEVDSRSAALFGLDTVIISPNQISQTLKMDSRTSGTKSVCSVGQSAAKRRTLTPPLVSNLKLETESTPFSASLTSSPSSSSNVLVGGLFQQATDTSAFQREKTVYLSPKLKQLLQTQDIQKSTITLITESHRLASPLSVTSLQGVSGRFKRRTASPQSSPQLSPVCKADACKAEAGTSNTFKVSKLESYSMSPPGSLLDKDDSDVQNLSGSNVYRRLSSSSGGNACNQQPLDLSNSVLRSSDSTNKTLGDSALDLSLQRKSFGEPELKGNPAPQLLIKKRKPNTSMLEKVLMNEYAGLTSPGEEGSSALASLGFHSRSSSMMSESTHPSPPSLTPVTMNPCSPGNSSLTSPTPPPPVLPTIPSPPPTPRSPLSQPSDSSALRPLPVLSPKMSPRASRHSPHLDSKDIFDEQFGSAENNVATPLHPMNTPLKDTQVPTAAPSPSEPASVDLHTQNDVPCAVPCSSQPSGKLNRDADSEESVCPDLAVSSHLESPSLSSSASPISHDPAPPVLSSFLHTAIKEEPHDFTDEFSLSSHTPEAGVDSSQPVAADKPCEVSEVDSLYCKSFVCNVCEKPFDSIKELSGHIMEHAVDWPFKCEFCVQLFGDTPALLAHRTTLHGVGKIFVCSICSKEFAFLINLQQHQKDLHPKVKCTHTTVENGKLRPQNYTDPSRAKEESSPATLVPDSSETKAHNISDLIKMERDVNGNHTEDGPEDPNEELYTTIRIMASEGGKPKVPNVRLGINQHYPSYKPPPFPYHNRSHAGSVASATNFTTHNIPQTFSTAIRCTKCGDSFDNLPELHKHILACASASDKKRYTPKKNPIPLKQIVKCQNGVVSPSSPSEGQNAFRRMGQPKRLNFNQDLPGKMKLSALKKKNQLVQKAISQKNKMASVTRKAAVKDEIVQELNVCPHCSREFTYPASLNKHISVSCPMKPVVKKGKKGTAEVKKEAGSAVDKNMNLKKKASDCEMQQTESEPVKPTAKSRARSIGATDPEPLQTSKSKTNSPGRLKRPASFPPQIPFSKKSKKGQVQSLPLKPSSLNPAGDTMQHPAVKKEAMPKRLAETKSPPQQLKKDDRVSLRARERAGGPVTRSLQMASAIPLAEVETEEPSIPEPQESQEALMK